MMELLFALCLLTSLSVAPFSAAVTAAAAVTAEATSGRARRADGKHRRKAQTRRRARGELASHTNASSTASLSDSSTPAVGVCRATRINDPGHCESGLSGSWTTRSHGISDLEQCAAKCRLCVGLRARGLGRPYSPLAPTYTVTLTLTMSPDAICVQGAASSHSRQGAVNCSVLICIRPAAAMDTHVPAAQGSLCPRGEDHGTRVHRVNQPRVASWHRRRLLLVP